MKIKNQFSKPYPKIAAILSMGLGVMICVSFCIVFSNGINALDVRMSRTNGYSSGNDIQGNFRLTVNGPDNLTLVKIFFNETEEYSTTEHEFQWNFNTDNFTLGETNITVQAWDTQNNLYQWSVVRNFVSADVNTPYWVMLGGIGVLFGVIGLISYKKQKKAAKAPPPQKTDVDIKLDKDLL